MYGVSNTFLQTAVSLDSKTNAQYISHRGVYCHLGKLGPAGCWRGEENKCKCHRESMTEHESIRNPKKTTAWNMGTKEQMLELTRRLW